MLGAIAGMGAVGFRINLTPSAPIGLWRILPLDRAARDGDVIFICPPVTDVMREARRRGYLRRGICTGGFAPLIKTIAAISGQVIAIDGSTRIDGKAIEHSQLMPQDGRGRWMQPYCGGVLPPGTVYLHSDFPGSYDSRYFGPLPVENILGLAREVWTYAP
jgi:conjugative transfer signal peptidase TraF